MIGEHKGSTDRLLALPYREGSLSVWALSEAAAGCCRLLWLMDEHSGADHATQRLLRRLGSVVDLTGEVVPAWPDIVGERAPDGIVVFSDHNMVAFAELAAALRLPFHSVETAEQLTDKHLQRRALGEHGLAVPQHWTLPTGATRQAVDGVAAEARFPAVLKPQRGADSRLTFPVRSAEELRGLATANRDRAMVVEEYLADTAPMLGDGFANYLSVESVVQSRNALHFATTGRFPPAPPFRETGFFIPSTLGGALADEVLALATAALAALGVEEGFLHTEIKLTPDGPRVIEVNGRLGGGIPAMLGLVSGVAVVRLAMRAALGEDIATDDFGPCKMVGYRLLFQAPMSATKVVSVEGLELVAALEGVNTVSLHREPGSALDWRTGNHDYVFSVLGLAADHRSVVEAERAVRELVTVEYS